jgi:hypothetical protein
MSRKQSRNACLIPLPFRCQSRFEAANSAAGGPAGFIDKLLIYLGFSATFGWIWDGKLRFSPDDSRI